MIDTCGSTGSVAIADTGSSPAILAEAALPGRSASERLVAAIRELAASSGVSLAMLDAVAVVHGPGSFTGVRVGLSAAKGLCEALHLPLVAISRLAVLAHCTVAPKDSRIYALLDAGRGELYVGEYKGGVCAGEALTTKEVLLARMESGHGGESACLAVTCEASVAAALGGLNPALVAEPQSKDALPLAIARLEAGEFDDLAALDANYLRRTDAEIFSKPSAKAVAGPIR